MSTPVDTTKREGYFAERRWLECRPLMFGLLIDEVSPMAAKSILFDNRVRVPADMFDLALSRCQATSGGFPDGGCNSFYKGDRHGW